MIFLDTKYGSRVYLLRITEDPLKLIYIAARCCYSEKLDLSEEININLIKELIKKGHLSVLEHVSTTWLLEGVSRVLTHQLVRHRIASYSQQSLRYVSAENMSLVRTGNKEIDDIIEVSENYSKHFYRLLIEKGVKKELARMIIPQGVRSNIVVTMNLRELMYFFNHRCCIRAQEEIREVANKMKLIMYKILPEIKEFFGSKCEAANTVCFDECDKKKNKT